MEENRVDIFHNRVGEGKRIIGAPRDPSRVQLRIAGGVGVRADAGEFLKNEQLVFALAARAIAAVPGIAPLAVASSWPAA